MSVFLSLFFVLQVIIGHLILFCYCFDLTFYKVYSLIFLSTVSILGKRVLQTPSDLRKKEDEFLEIKCSHSIQDYYVVQWYKQSQGTMDLQLMGYINVQQVTTEPEFNGKIKLDGDGRNNVTLSISTLRLTDSAVYFCAASYTVLRITSV